MIRLVTRMPEPVSLEDTGSGAVVRAVASSGQVPDAFVTVIDHEVADQRADSGLVVAADVHGPRSRASRQGHDRHDAGQPGDPDRRQHPVVEDEAVSLPGHRGNALQHVVVVVGNRAHQDVESTTLCFDLDPAVDDVDVEKALVLVLEERFIAATNDDADHFFESVR